MKPNGDEAEVLLIEDNIIFRETLREILTSAFPHLRIAEFGDGREALKKIGSHPPAVIFVDIQLPGQNGLVLTRSLRGRFPRVVIAVLTEHDIPEYRQTAYECGANHFLAKGSTRASEILTLVRSVTGRPNRITMC